MTALATGRRLLGPHADWRRARAPEVRYSARILFRELRLARVYQGSDDTVKLFLQPLRAARLNAVRVHSNRMGVPMTVMPHEGSQPKQFTRRQREDESGTDS